jgi:hypothetical protein
MSAPVKTPQLQRAFRIRRGLTLALQLMLCGVSIAVPLKPSLAAGCSFAPQGEGRVAAVLDARGFRLEDGREVRLAGIEPILSATQANDRAAALAAIIEGREVTLHGSDDAPDRYGR